MEPNEADTTTRNQIHGMWAAVASRWDEHADDVDQRAEPVTAAIVDAAALAGGERVLELACGPGGLGLAIAEAGAGEVVLSDVATEMTAIAARRAADRGLGNVRTAVLDLEAIDEPEESFDVVVCREGLMFAVDPERAAGELRRVLRPGGRAVVSVWADRARNPWLGLLLDAVGDEIGMPVPPPSIPGPFALGDGERLGEVLRAGGFRDVRVRELDLPMVTPSFDIWWRRTSDVAGPVAGILAGLPEDRRARIESALRAAVAPYRAADGELTIPGAVLLASGVR